MVRVLASVSLVPGFVLAAVVAFVSPMGLVVVSWVWSAPAPQVPVHWGGGGADNFESSSALFWSALLPSVVSAVLAAAMALLLDETSGRRSTAAAFAGLVLFGAALSLQWPVAQLTAADRALRDGVGPPFLLYFCAVPLAAIAGAAAMLWTRSTTDSGTVPASE